MLSNTDLLNHLEKDHPLEVYRVGERIDPRECEHAGYEEALRERGKRPWVIFDQSLRADGGKWRGLFSTCNFNSFSLMAMAYGLDLKKSRPFDLILKHHHGMTHARIGSRLFKWPVAIVGGHHPAFSVGCGTAFNLDVDEYAAAGGIYKEATGEELRVTDSELWGKDLVVPADAEVILEGYITERQEEAGLWCDAWQNYTKPSKQNVFRVEAVTMREKPLYVSNWPGVSVQTSLSGAAEVYGLLRPHFRDIRGINFPFVQTVIVSAKLPARGMGVNLAAMLYSMKQNIKHVIVVDEDVDPYDFQQVFFAMTSRVDASRDVQVLNVMRHVNDPGGEGRTVGGMIIDATRPRDSEEFEIAKPSESALEKARKVLDSDVVDSIPNRSALSR